MTRVGFICLGFLMIILYFSIVPQDTDVRNTCSSVVIDVETYQYIYTYIYIYNICTNIRETFRCYFLAFFVAPLGICSLFVGIKTHTKIITPSEGFGG